MGQEMKGSTVSEDLKEKFFGEGLQDMDYAPEFWFILRERS